MKRVLTFFLLGMFLSSAALLTSCGSDKKAKTSNSDPAGLNPNSYQAIFSNNPTLANKIVEMLNHVQYAILADQNQLQDADKPKLQVFCYDFNYIEGESYNPTVIYSESQKSILTKLITDYRGYTFSCF